jgi:hypothetical protein
VYQVGIAYHEITSRGYTVNKTLTSYLLSWIHQRSDRLFIIYTPKFPAYIITAQLGRSHKGGWDEQRIASMWYIRNAYKVDLESVKERNKLGARHVIGRSFYPFVYWLGTKCNQPWNFLQQFSLVHRNNLTSFSICSLKSHWHNIIIIRHIHWFLRVVCFYEIQLDHFVPMLVKTVSNTCSAKTYYINGLTHKNCKRVTTSNHTAQLTD